MNVVRKVTGISPSNGSAAMISQPGSAIETTRTTARHRASMSKAW